MSDKQKLALVLNTLAVALILLFIFLAVKDFLNQTKTNVEKESAYHLELIANARVNSVTAAAAAIEADARFAADALACCGGLDAPKAKDFLALFSARNMFDKADAAYPDGSVLLDSGARVEEEPWFLNAAAGKSGIDASEASSFLTVYAPVLEQGQVTGVFFARYNAARLVADEQSRLGTRPVFFFLVREDGAFLYQSGTQSLFPRTAAGGLFEALEGATFPGGATAASVKDGIERGTSGSFRIRTQAQAQAQDAYVYYTPAGVGGWRVLIAVDYAALGDQNAALGRMAVELLAKVLFALLVATLIVLFYSWASKQAAVNSANRINAMANSIPCGVQQFDPSGSMAFRYVSDGFFEMSGYSESELKTVFKNSFLSVIHPEDRGQVEALVRGSLDTEAPLELKYRIITKDGRVVWLLNRATLCADAEGGSYYQCVCVDITRLKQVEQTLASKAQIDQLTGLYNRETARMLIREFFSDASSRYGSHAFFMLDMDCFKKHNDTYGHVEGDRLLCRVAGILRSTFRGTDIICRLAGDEFVAFMKSAESREIVAEKAQSILRSVKELINTEDAHAPSASVSIGISIAPEDGGSFEELYKKADEALYVAKRSGKNRYVLFDSMPSFAEQDFFDEFN